MLDTNMSTFTSSGKTKENKIKIKIDKIGFVLWEI